MKNIAKLPLVVFLLVIFSQTQRLHAFNGKDTPVSEWTNPTVFIENRGQFPVTGAKDTKVLYAYDNSSTLIYFRRDGFSYSLLSKTPKEEKEKEEHFDNEKEWLEHEAEEKKVIFKRDDIHIKWENANTNCEVVAEGKVSDYYNYAVRDDQYHQHSINNIPAFTRLTYKNIYPHIDLVYVFKEAGLKYSFIVHPGGNPADIKMTYSGMDKLSKNEQGQIVIKTMFGNIIDQAPVSFYENDPAQTITSEFVKDKHTISFMTGAYDNARTIVIDPWQLTSGLGFGNSQKVWECEHDNASNSYFWGGDTPNRLKKFNNAGTLQWTYNSPWDTANFWVGSIITDNNGVTYCTGGSNGEISKVSTAGAQVWFNNPNGLFGPLFEYWHMSFNCDQTSIVVGGMRAPNPFSIGNYRGAIMTINMASGAVTGFTPVGWVAGINIKEVRSICSAPTGGYYFLTLDSIGFVNAAVVQQWKTTSGYGFGYGNPSYAIQGNMGMSAIRANAGFIYTVNGSSVHKRSTTNGAILATAAIPGGISTTSGFGNTFGCSGLDIDSCGNVYVGSGNQIVKYDANLVVLSSQPTPAAVYDVSVSKTGQVVACGNGFMGTYAMGACNPMQAICVTNVLAATSSSTNVTCFNQCNGTASVTASGGTAPYTYSWAPSGGTGASAVNLCAMNYTCTITDNVGATVTQTFNITQPTAVTATPSQTNLACNGVCNGSAAVVVSGGVPGYTYSWAPSGGTGASATGLCANNYTCTITDANGCPITQAFAITEPIAISANATSTSSGCSSNTGTATTTASGGTGAFTYSWAPTGGTAATATGLAPGSYTCTVTDANGCTSTAITVVGGTGSPSATVQSQSDVLCNGGNTGTATVNATGGTPGYTYAWSPAGGTNATGTGMTAGNYTCTITDAAGCTTTQSVAITEPPAITLSASSTPTGCNNVTGTVTAIVSGGVGPYNYLWAPSGGTTATVTNLAAGIYTVQITDANGCIATTSISISSIGGPAVSVQSTGNVTCFGGTDGTGTISATGNSPFTYAWSPSGGNAATATGLAAGTYSVTVVDANNCVTIQTLTITEPAAVAAAPTSTPATCGNTNGTADAVASGGVGPYTYAWSNSQTTATISNLAGGSYSVTVTDANGCTTTATVVVANTGAPVVTLQSSSNIACFGGTTGAATVNVTGGSAPYTYAWSPSGGTAASATGLSAGTYTVTVTGSDGCIQTQTVTLTQPTAIAVTGASVPEDCGDGTGVASVTASGGTGPYTYAWSNASTNDTISNLIAGSYSVVVTDANGCTSSSTVVVTNTGSALANAGTSVTITAGQTTQLTGTGGITYSWSPSGSLSCSNCQTPIASPTVTTVYTLTVTDANGCTASDTVTVYVDIACGELYFPNAFSPNGDLHNDVLYVRGNCIKALDLQIYNRWGEKVFQTTDPAYGWDGTWRGVPCETAVFTYTLNAILLDGTEISKKGNVSLVK